MLGNEKPVQRMHVAVLRTLRGTRVETRSDITKTRDIEESARDRVIKIHQFRRPGHVNRMQ